MRSAIVLVVLSCVLGVACGSSGKGGSATTPSTVPPTASPTSATTAPSPSTTQPAGPATTAPAPRRSVFVLSVDAANHTVTVDPMEFLTGAAATRAYHEANPHARPGGPDNDYFIVNPTKDHDVLTLAPNVDVRVVQAGGTVHTVPVAVPLSTLASYPALPDHPFWLTVKDNQVTEIAEQFVP